jgi:diaminopropionate ammonia-lyase
MDRGRVSSSFLEYHSLRQQFPTARENILLYKQRKKSVLTPISWNRYQTMFDEIEYQILETTGQQTITHVVTPVGAGSLSSAVVTHFERTKRSPKPTIITVEPESAACLKASLEIGMMASVHATYTICTGMCCGTLSASAWPILKEGVTVAITVNDAEVDEAISLLQKYSIHAGPCGAASLAGIRKLARGDEINLSPKSVVLILCTEARRGYQMRV